MSREWILMMLEYCTQLCSSSSKPNALCHNFLLRPTFSFCWSLSKFFPSVPSPHKPPLTLFLSFPLLSLCMRRLISLSTGQRKGKEGEKGGSGRNDKRLTKWHSPGTKGERDRGELSPVNSDRRGVIRDWQSEGVQEYWVKQWRIERKSNKETGRVVSHVVFYFVLFEQVIQNITTEVPGQQPLTAGEQHVGMCVAVYFTHN